MEQYEDPDSGLSVRVDNDRLDDSIDLEYDRQSGVDLASNVTSFCGRMTGALFDADSFIDYSAEGQEQNQPNDLFWDLPKLKAPERGDHINSLLANMINTACTSQCSLNGIIDLYKIPQNCERECPLKVNDEIWLELSRFCKVQTTDKYLREIQSLVATGLVPFIELA